MKHLLNAFFVLTLAVVLAAGCANSTPTTGDSATPTTPPTTSGGASGSPQPPTGTAEEPTSGGSPARMYTAAEVATHATTEDCWIIVNGGVYDLSAFEDKHPGGVAPIAANCGKDATKIFNMRPNGTPHPDRARDTLKTYQIGTLAP